MFWLNKRMILENWQMPDTCETFQHFTFNCRKFQMKLLFWSCKDKSYDNRNRAFYWAKQECAQESTFHRRTRNICRIYKLRMSRVAVNWAAFIFGRIVVYSLYLLHIALLLISHYKFACYCLKFRLANATFFSLK